jgi:2-oxoisovalerate dehydrogenase E1 component alpha subunit
MPSIRVDGNDLFAIYAATKEARRLIIEEKRPVLIEAISYRVGDHSTSDFSERYRDEEEMKKWNELIAQFSSPIERLEKYMKKVGLYDEERTKKLRADAKKSVRDSLKAASTIRLPPIDELFKDVYEELPSHLIEQ